MITFLSIYKTTSGESFKPLLNFSSIPSINRTSSIPILYSPITPSAPNLSPSMLTDIEYAQPYLVSVDLIDSKNIDEISRDISGSVGMNS